MLDILDAVQNWLDEQHPIALATVVNTWGSSPRAPGSKMAVTADMAIIGSVSAGCVENAVIQEAVGSLQDGKPRLLHYGVSDDTAWDVGLTCGGKISIYVEPLDLQLWHLTADLVQQDNAHAAATILEGDLVGKKVLVGSDGATLYASAGLTSNQTAILADAAYQSLQAGQTKPCTVAELNVFIEVHVPRPRLIIVGGAHVAMALQQFARQLGFEVMLVDPRKTFATAERFPDVAQILHTYPDKALPQIGLTNQTYLAVLTHDPKIDDPALRTALPAAVRYIGVLSSRRTHEKRIERLTAQGVDTSLFERIHTPIGLNIGAKTPEEIALSIMAEIIAVKNGVAQ
ncbi:MAG: XdhC family protein [Chloroflexi bacterium]|nr:XdhC family protein [Chloroflexota bacterium]